MALVPLASEGNFLHIYDFHVKPGQVPAFIKLFNEFDYSEQNPMHKSRAQVKDGMLVQDVANDHHFWLIAEWSDIEEHARIRRIVMEMAPAFADLVEGKFIPSYGRVVSSTPQSILDAAS